MVPPLGSPCPICMMLFGRRVRLWHRECGWLALLILLWPMEPLGAFILLLVPDGVLHQRGFKSLCCSLLLATRSPDLHRSSGEILHDRIQLVTLFGNRGKEPVRVVVVIPGPKGINYSSSQVCNFGRLDLCSFNPVHCCRKGFRQDDFHLCFYGGWTVSELS